MAIKLKLRYQNGLSHVALTENERFAKTKTLLTFKAPPSLTVIFSPVFKLKSRIGTPLDELNGSEAALSSLWHSLLCSCSATLKSKASFLSLNAMPMKACLPWAFCIFKTKYRPLSNVLSTHESSVTEHVANTWLVVLSSRVITARRPFAEIFNFPAQVCSLGQSDARWPSNCQD